MLRSSPQVHDARLRPLGGPSPARSGRFVLYWMQQSQRAGGAGGRRLDEFLVHGRDPSSFANVGWIFGLHDRPWPERPVFGTVRSMTAGGLQRNSDIDAYVAAVGCRVAEAQGAGVFPP